jgi:hypothetical protein
LFLHIGGVSGHGGDWIISSRPVNAAGHAATLPRACPLSTTNFPQCLGSHGVKVAITYQPASHYWPLQWTETGIYVILAIGLAGIGYWRVRRLS